MISAESYLNEFASDRRHMRRPDNSWIKPPPPYPPIATSSEYPVADLEVVEFTFHLLTLQRTHTAWTTLFVCNPDEGQVLS